LSEDITFAEPYGSVRKFIRVLPVVEPERELVQLCKEGRRNTGLELDDYELLKKLFPKPVRRLVEAKDPDKDDDDDEPDDD